MTKGYKTLGCECTPELYYKIDSIAKRRGITKNQLLVTIIQSFLSFTPQLKPLKTYTNTNSKDKEVKPLSSLSMEDNNDR